MNCCACGKELIAESSWYDEFAETATCRACLGSVDELTVRLGRTQSVLKQMGDKWFAEKARAEKAEAEVARLRGLCWEAAEAVRCAGTCGGCSRCRLANCLRTAAKGGTHG